jgi:signal transduction histidine kinase
MLDADPRRLTQVVQNLLSNAFKFTQEGKVTVRVDRQPEGVRLQVIDTGIGIGPADLPRVFESYRQAGDLTARRKGSGLGLAIAKHLVELHGGTITVESELDRGSTFTVTLPARREGAAAGGGA